MTDSTDLKDVIDRRVKDNLSLASETKDLTAALKVAIEWWSAYHAKADDGAWGTALGRKPGG